LTPPVFSTELPLIVTLTPFAHATSAAADRSAKNVDVDATKAARTSSASGRRALTAFAGRAFGVARAALE